METRATEMSLKPLHENWLSALKSGASRLCEKASRHFFIIFFASILLFAGALIWFPGQYQTNDDAAMNMYAAGTNLGQPPSEFLLFQHFIIGLGLKFLYTHLPQIPWYGALLYTYLFLSSVIIGHVISRLHHRFSIVGIWIVLFLLFYLQVIICPQFTICAGYLAISGILLLYSVIYDPYASKRVNRGVLIIAGGLLIWAGMVRFYSLLLVIVSMAPLYIYLLVARFSDTWRRLLPILCGVVVTSVFLNWTQISYYEHSPGWENFYSYNNVRAEFIDRHKITWDESTEPLFRHIGWSRNDLAMLISWFYLDPSVYSFRNLTFISQNTSLVARPEIDWGSLFADLKKSLISYGGLATLLLFALVLARNGRATQTFALLALLWYGILFAGITVVERHLPVRVWLVMLCDLFITEVILWCCPIWEPATRTADRRFLSGLPIRSWVIASLFAFCCWGQLKAIKKLSDNCRFYQKNFREDLATLEPRANQLFVTWGGDFPYQSFQLPGAAEPASKEMQFLGLGVGNHEPVVQNRLRGFGIEDLYRAFYERNDVFLICVEMKKKLLAQYILEHYHTKVAVKTIFKGKTFTVCKVVKES